MKRITIERYDSARHDSPNGPWEYSGLIEGADDTGNHWIMWLDKDGRPEVFWPERDETGAVVGPGIPLTSEAHNREVEARKAKMRQILDMNATAEDIVQRLRHAVDAADSFKDQGPEFWENMSKLMQKRAFGKELNSGENGRPA